MPKWTDYTIKTEPADNDEVMVLDAAGKANKRLGLSALSDWIIGKIANKVFENLQTQNKTILGAINELNSNFNTSWQNGNGKSIFDIFIPSGTCGIYSYYNIADIPNLEAANAFVGIFKWNEGMLVVANVNIYITVSSLDVWEKKWHKISSTLVS